MSVTGSVPHRLQLGASLVIELERDLESDAEDRLEHLLCCWSLYHHEAAKRLCSNEVAADVLCSSADPEVKATAEEASETSESLILVSMKFVSCLSITITVGGGWCVTISSYSTDCHASSIQCLWNHALRSGDGELHDGPRGLSLIRTTVM